MPHKQDENKVIVVATQADEQQWTISEAQGKEFARKIRAPFVLTSSVTNVGIDELRNTIIQVTRKTLPVQIKSARAIA